MRQRDALRVMVLRLMLSALKDREIELRGSDKTMDESQSVAILRTLVKKRQESARLYEQGHRPELAQKEKDEIAIIETFLPKAMDDGQIEKAVDTILKSTEASSMEDMGKVMGALKKAHGHEIDMKKAGEIVRSRLS